MKLKLSDISEDSEDSENEINSESDAESSEESDNDVAGVPSLAKSKWRVKAFCLVTIDVPFFSKSCKTLRSCFHCIGGGTRWGTGARAPPPKKK